MDTTVLNNSSFDADLMSPDHLATLVNVEPFDHKFGGVRWLMAVLREPMQSWPRELYEADYVTSGRPGRRGILLADPDLIQRTIVREADGLEPPRAPVRALRPLLGRGLLTSDGPHWRWQRRIVAPTFRHDRLESFVPDMIRAAEHTADRWSGLPEASVLDVGHEMMRTTFEVIAETMLSGGRDVDETRFQRAFVMSLGTTKWRILYTMFHLPDWVPYPRQRKARAAEGWMRDIALDIVASRRAALDAGAERRADLLDLLLQAQDPEGGGGAMADRDIADNILTFIVAGYETTSNALTWAFYALSQHPDVTARLLAEVAETTGGGPLRPEHLDRLVYTRQVVQEALRLFPSVPVITRKATRTMTIGPLELRPGDTLIIPVWVIHRHRKLWSDPDRFEPDRFSAEASARRHRYSFLPFGAGPRICIGMNFALNEAVIILATLLPRFRVDLAPSNAPEITVKLTLRPRKPMRMSLSHRSPRAADGTAAAPSPASLVPWS